MRNHWYRKKRCENHEPYNHKKHRQHRAKYYYCVILWAVESLFFKTVLGINTATHRESVAIVQNNKILAERNWTGNKNESSILLKSIDKCLQKSQLEFSDLDGVISVSGPGPFSAVRIGTATANAIAFSIKKPIYAVTTEAVWLARVNAILKQSMTHRTTGDKATNNNVFVVMSAGKGHIALIDFAIPDSLDARATISQQQIFSVSELIEHILKTEVRNEDDDKNVTIKNPITLLCDLTHIEKDELQNKCPKTWNIFDESDSKVVLPFAKALIMIPPALIYHSEANIVTPRYLRPPTITQAKKPLYATS